MGTKSGYAHTVGSKLAVINRYDSEFCRAHMKKWGIGTHEMAVLMQLHFRGELYQDEIIAETHMNRTTLSKVISKLAAKGFVYTTKSNEDKRIVYSGLTKAGKKMMPEIVGMTREWIAEATHGFSKSDIEDFERYLDRILDNLRTPPTTALAKRR